MRKFELKKMVGDNIMTRYITGPSTYEEWMASWRVYRTTLIALGAVSAGALELYVEGIRSLVTLYPRSWGNILLADEEMRYENWDRMLETLEESDVPVAGFNKQRPWDHIVATSSFSLGTDGTQSGWWNIHLVAGLNNPQSAEVVTQGLTGRLPTRASSSTQPPPQDYYHAPPPRREDKKKKGGGKGADTAKGGGKGGGLCNRFNSPIGCNRFRCPLNYTHRCSVCNSTEHGATECAGSGIVKPDLSGKAGKAGRGKKSHKK